jgi:hypothetical protein
LGPPTQQCDRDCKNSGSQETHEQGKYVRFDVLTAVLLRIQVFLCDAVFG